MYISIFPNGRPVSHRLPYLTISSHQEEIPVTIGLFIEPGDIGPGTPYYGGTDNRSFEYDAVTDRYARFLLEEMIPALEKKYNITDNPEGRVLVGFSSGGHCAFNAAWHRPNEFGNVISHCGSYTDMRGGHVYPPLVRRTPQETDSRVPSIR